MEDFVADCSHSFLNEMLKEISGIIHPFYSDKSV